MKQFPLSPYHQFSNSSLNSDFYDRYLSHDGHQPLQTPLIGIERTQDLLSLKLPPHGPDDQDSQRFPKEWAFEDTTKHDSDRSQSPNSAARLANSAGKLTQASDRDKDKIGHSRDHQQQHHHQIGIATGAKSKELGLCAPIRGNQLALLSQVRDGGGGTQQVELSSGFFFRYKSALSSSSALSKSSCNSNNSDDEAADRQRPANSSSSTSSNSSNSSINNNHNNGSNYRGGDDDDDDEDEDNNRSKHDIFAESMKHFNPLKRNRTPENISGASDAVCYDLRSKNSSPDKQQQQQQQQHSRRQNGSSTEHGGSDSDNAASSMSQQYHGQESCFGLDPSKQRFQYVLAAPISVATKLNEDTMTYLNQGQAYEIKLGNTTDVAEARKGFMCSIINIGFHERHMQQAENELWQQWSQQHPNEKIFSVDMKLSYNVYGVDSDGLNKYEFLWDSSKAAGVFIRINSISTEFTPKKHGGEKGVPFRLSIETFSYNSKTHDSYFISAASCQIKVFKPKGAERKIRSDRDKIYKRPPSEQEKYHRSCDHTTFSECSLSSLHPMADTSLCYYRHSHGHFASKQVTSSGAVSAGGSSSAGSAAAGSAAAAASQTQNGHSSSSDEELEQRAGQTATTAPPGAGRETDQNNGNTSNSNNSSNHHHNNNRSSTNHSGEDRDTGSSRPNSPYSQASAALHHRASTHHHHHPAHLHYSSSHLDRELNSSPGQQQLHASSTGGPNEHDMFNNAVAGMAATNELHHSYPAMYSAAAAATAPPPTSHHHQVRSQHSFGHPAMSHYYGHPLPATLVPPHHHHHHHPHMGPAPGYGIAPGPMSHPAAGFALPSAHHAQSHHTLSDVKSSIYRHHQLDSKQPYATAATYGGAASSNMSNNLSLLPHEQQSTTKDHHTSSLASANNCYSSTNENYNNNNISTPRHRSASTSLTTATTHCQSYARHHHLDNYFTSTTNHSENNLSAQNNHLNSTTNSTNANTNSSSNSNNNNILHNQWGAQQQSSATATNHQNNRSDAIFGYTDCGNLQASESPSSCCSRYQNGSINQTYASQSTDESVADIKQPPSSAHITVNSNCIEVVSWFASNRFGALAKIFNNFSGADLLRLCKTELIEICGLTEGIRLYNSLHNRPIKPRRVLYICLETDDIYHPIYLYDLSLSELLGEISLILETNSKAIDDNDEDCVNPSHNSSQTGSSKTGLDRTGSTSSSSSDSRSSSRPLSAETNDDEVYQSEQYFESDMHGSLSQGHDQSSEKSSSLQISRLLVDGVASVKVVATEKVVQMLEDESVWTLSVKTRLSGTVEACITACRQSHKRHCK